MNPDAFDLQGPGRRAARLMAHAPEHLRTAYLKALETMNERLANRMEDDGFLIPQGECFLRLSLSTSTRSQPTKRDFSRHYCWFPHNI